jgi:hypothetical protein
MVLSVIMEGAHWPFKVASAIAIQGLAKHWKGLARVAEIGNFFKIIHFFY